MNDKKTWFIGYTSRLWLPVSIEGWLITVFFFIGLSCITVMNNHGGQPLTFMQILLILAEFLVLLGSLYFITKGHVDKRY